MAGIQESLSIAEQQQGEFGELLIEQIINRRSTHPRRLVYPAPDHLAVRRMVEAAVTAVDHGGLRPWRFISIRGAALSDLGDVFVEIKRSNNNSINTEELQREKDRAHSVPFILAVIERAQPDHSVVPVKEQHASIGAAIQNIVMSCHVMGFGAKMVSGRKVSHPMLAQVLNLSREESVFGFVCMGTAVSGTSQKARPEVDEVLSDWSPGVVLRQVESV